MTSAWSRIWQPLNAALPAGACRGGATLTRFEQDERDVTAFFNDGTSATGDLLVAADGLHSTVRAQLLPELKPQYAGYVAWRGVVEQRELAPELHAMMFERMVFGFPDGELMLSIPMPGPDDGPHRGERRCHFVWFRSVHEDALPGLCTDATGRRHGVSIPPPLIRPELIAALKADADGPPRASACRAGPWRRRRSCCSRSSIWNRRASCRAASRCSAMLPLSRGRMWRPA